MKKITILLFLLISTIILNGQTLPCVNPTASNTAGNGIITVNLGTLNHVTPAGEGFSREYDSVGVIIPDFTQNQSFSMYAINAGGITSQLWIDWNADGDFFDSGESYSVANRNGDTAFYNISVPPVAVPGNRIIRILGGVSPTSNPCNSINDNVDVEDYRINILGVDMVIDSVVVEQVNSCFIPNENCQPVLRVAVHTSGTLNPISITGFDFNTNGSTDAADDITDVRVLYTGDTLPFFSCSTIFGNIGAPPPVGVFNIAGNQLLNSFDDVTHYFWLAYDIATGATPSNLIDAENIMVSTTSILSPTIIPINPNPIGTGSVLSQTEICDNGIDDDCDGLVDCFDPDCSGVGECISEVSNFFYGLPTDTCTSTLFPSVSNGNLFKEWSYTDIALSQGVVVGDLDNDDIPEVVVNNASRTEIIILDGRTGSVKRNVTLPSIAFSFSVIADIDNNGMGEIYCATQPRNMICYDYATNNILWDVSYPSRIGSPLSMADFNGDGVPELFDDQYIINASTGNLMGQYTTSNNLRPMAIDVLSDEDCSACSGLELVIGTSVFSVDINAGVATIEEVISISKTPIFKNFPFGSSRYSTAADLDNDNLLDIVTISNTMLWSWNPRTLAIIDSISLRRVGNPNIISYQTIPVEINDINNDGNLDFLFGLQGSGGGVRLESLVALDNNFNILWTETGLTDASGVSFPTIFDLNGDGNKEIIFRPEFSSNNSYLYVFDALSGNRLDSIFANAATAGSDIGVIVADVTGNGRVELVTTGALTTSGSDRHELMVISSCEDWVCGRRVWNQHNYHPSFVNDDLTIPREQQNHGAIGGINHWGNQVSFADTSGNNVCPLPDVVVTIDNFQYVSCNSINVSITACNIGQKSIQNFGCFKTKYVSYYDGDPLTGGILLLTDTVNSDLNAVGSCGSITSLLTIPDPPFVLYTVVNDSGANALTAPNITFLECNTDNNMDSLTIADDIVFTVFDTVSICETDSIFLAGGYQNLTGFYVDTIQVNQVCDSVISTSLTVVPFLDATILTELESPLCVDDDTIRLVAADTGGVWIGSGIQDMIAGIFDPGIADIGINTIDYVISGVCNDSSSTEIVVDLDCSTIFLPNSFTPNGDGNNDTFFPMLSGIELYVLTVYNRWGELIFESDELNPRWDGTYKGKLVKNGVYLWKITYKTSIDAANGTENSDDQEFGNVNVIR